LESDKAQLSRIISDFLAGKGVKLLSPEEAVTAEGDEDEV
jgi:hypothetical protein